MNRAWASIAVTLLLCAPAAGQWPSALWSGGSSAPQNPAVVRIMAPGRDSISYGSGSLVAKTPQHGLVITNWHVVNEATGQIMVMFPDGFKSAGTIVKVDRDWDLAAIAVWRPNAEPLPLATTAPQPGETLTIAGYGSGNYRAASGRCTQYVAPGSNFPFEMVELATTARQGDSGGPILNSRGELAGVLFGEGGGRTAGSYCGRVQWFLAGLSPSDSTAGAGSLLASPGALSPSLTDPSIAKTRTVTTQFNRLAPPAQPGARVNSLAALGMPQADRSAVATTVAITATPPRANRPTTTFTSVASAGAPGIQNSAGWQSAPSGGNSLSRDNFSPRGNVAPMGIANPDRDPPAARGRPIASDTHLADVPPLRGIPDTAAFGHTSEIANPPADGGRELADASADDHRAVSIGWTDIAGHTLGEQVKTVLATIGGLAVFMQAIGWLSSDSKGAKKKSADDEDEEDDDEDDDD